MIATTTAQTLELTDMIQGREYLLVISDSPGANTLKFKHLSNPTPVDHPAHTGIYDTTVITRFLCPSPVMAVVFDAPPATPYFLSCELITAPEF